LGGEEVTEIWANIAGGLAEALVGGLIGFFIAYYAFRLQQSRTVVEYEVFSMPLLRFKPTPERPIAVSVDKSLLTAKETDKGQLVQVDSAYGFEIEVQNAGNQPIGDCMIEIQLDEDAKIIEFETQPSSRPGYMVEAEQDDDSFNILRVVPQYLNRKERILIRVISTGNSSRKCEVDVRRMGLKVRERSPGRAMMGPVILLLLILPVLLLLALPPKTLVMQRTIEVLGLEVEQIDRVAWPKWLFPIFILPITLVYLRILQVTMKVQRRRTRGWGLEPSQKRRTGILSFLARLVGDE
jgi:hypothetical protein